MLTEQIVLTALPAGVDRERGVARVTCFVTLRLSGQGAQLGETRWAARWPEAFTPAIEGMAVEIDTVGPVPARVVSALPQPALWTALFPPGTPVEPHEPERWTHRPVATFGARTVHDYVVETVARSAVASPATMPTAIDLIGTLNDASGAWTSLAEIPSPSQLLGDGPLSTQRRERLAGFFSEPLRDRLDASVARQLADASAAAATRRAAESGTRLVVDGSYLPASSPGGANEVQSELARFLVFHHRPEQAPTPLPDAAQLAQDLDFHRILTAVGAYRFLQRRLGLAVDLEVPLDAVGVDPGRVRIVVPQVDLPIPRVAWTAYAPRGPGGDPAFWPAPRPEPVGERIADGLLDLTFRERFSLAQVDVDSAAFKTLGAALAAAAHAELPRPVGTPDADAPPALRSTGLAILHDGRAEALHGRMASSHNLLIDLEGPDPPTLFAEDVTRGYRLDVLDRRSPGWRSLHARRGHYVGVGAAAGALDEVVDDEGFVQLALGERSRPPDAPPDPDAAVYLHESIARWEGWSLSAPRPGLGLPPSPHAPTEGEPDTQPVPDANPALPDGVPVEVTFRAQPGTLPRLRVGAEYQLRARAVDLAGNGPTLAEADALLAAFDRTSTVAPVLPVQRRVFAFARFDPLAAPALALRRAVTEGESIAHVVVRSDHAVTAAAYAAATGYQADADRHVVPAKSSLQDAELLGRFDDAIGGAPAAVEAAYAIALRESGRLQADLLHPEEQLELPYLPDPWSAGVVMVGLPGLAAGTITRFAPDGSSAQEPDALPGLPPQAGVLILDWGTRDPWWRAQPLRLRAVEGDGAPVWDVGARLLTVSLPKSARVDVQVSSLPDESHLRQHGVWRALRALVTDPEAEAALLQLARTGRMWALCPARTVTLVHAVQRPLETPDVLALRAVREAGATATELSGEIRIHGASTDRIDVDASWEEWVDLPGSEDEQPPQRISRTSAALTTQIHLARDTAIEPPETERLATARYVEADDLVLLGAGPASDSAPGFVTSHELHDTRHREIAYSVVATSRFREYFRPELVAPDGALTRQAAPVSVDVPSSAAPPPPRLVYVIPMFGWERGTADRTRTSRRRGGGLRIFLGRPWYASGDGELLGAVIWPGGDCPVPDALDRLVTRWGFDPMWPLSASDSPPATPAAEHFRRRVAVGEGLPLREAPTNHVTVVGHDVEFDPARNLWTCDLELDLGDAYTPFVRLALVRYQPSSLTGAHLSSVAVAQIVQVAPERVVTVVAASDEPRSLSLVVTGPLHGAAWQAGALPFPYGSEVEVYVEERVDALPDPDLGWQRTAQATVTVDHGPGPAGADVRWSGRIQLPADHVEGRHRVVVVERERLVGDPPSFRRVQTARSTTTRIVFAEHFVV